ncbi:uncharacterized protein LOC109825044 isoform X2 [Asparagus officinalis]|uniref:uncharacterized protein LOC109825044 isoform X2 n=1 Tax=Asparagus officinalis TaxID=4686 RepID=UPI00098E1DB0|nr:uncharacterized protein LOC109825044 isoform X2 [Asparagus officinalis]XP_020247325.1 uncharacterized protein LOC109825044 isoform X2 [Asparagus officinalis]XP_020247326.1 uncharacterized protein LOC109825044 isoform X2 [Asparagus officinalis]
MLKLTSNQAICTSSILQCQLWTSTVEREKSATKEAISVLEKFVSSMYSNNRPTLGSCNARTVTKKRKTFSEETNTENIEKTQRNGADSAKAFGELVENVSSEVSMNVGSSLSLSLVKLTGSGLLLFTFTSNSFRHVVGVLSNILQALGSGDLKRPLWCNRIFPIQETCVLTEKNLQTVVSKLVQEYLGKEQESLERPIKFAVAYNRRGVEEIETKNSKSATDSKIPLLLDRESCFKIVAGAFKDVAKNSVVDLKSPEVAVIVELLPLSGVPNESVVAGVSILPHELIATKPRLCVKPLVSDTKATNKRN